MVHIGLPKKLGPTSNEKEAFISFTAVRANKTQTHLNSNVLEILHPVTVREAFK